MTTRWQLLGRALILVVGGSAVVIMLILLMMVPYNFDYYSDIVSESISTW